VALGAATPVGSAVGTDPENGRATIQLFGQNPNGTFTIVVVSLDPAAFEVGTQPVGFASATAAAGVYLYTPATNTFESLGIVISGSLQLDTVSTTSGGQVRGRFDVSTLRFPF